MTDEVTLDAHLGNPQPPPTLEGFLRWAKAVGCYPVNDAYERYSTYLGGVMDNDTSQ